MFIIIIIIIIISSTLTSDKLFGTLIRHGNAEFKENAFQIQSCGLITIVSTKFLKICNYLHDLDEVPL